ncbi:MAG: glycosyltransferase [Elusimicrobia bacterium]|nr:glycosyltransferase [Elusimicrobiota bacterium]
MKISCVIPTYNNLRLLTGTLESVLGQTRRPDAVYVIDNASSDGTASLKDRFPGIAYIRLPENTGSAGGFHEGIRAAVDGCDLLFLSDDDQVYNERALESLEAALLSLGPAAGAVRCAWPGYRGAAPAEVPDSVWSGTLIRAEVPRRIGLPLKELFLYAEDVEYFRRMRKNGLSLYVVPEARYLARDSGHKAVLGSPVWPTVVYKAPFRLYYAFRNEVFVYLRYSPWRVLRVLLYFLRVSLFLGPAGLSAALEGMLDGFRGRLGRKEKYAVRR